MAAYIPVPRDLTRVKSKVFFNLTKRQLICFGAAALIGVPFFFFLKSFGNVSLAALGMIIVMLPLFFLAMYEKDGQGCVANMGHIDFWTDCLIPFGQSVITYPTKGGHGT